MIRANGRAKGEEGLGSRSVGRYKTRKRVSQGEGQSEKGRKKKGENTRKRVSQGEGQSEKGRRKKGETRKW
eukprot:3955097-Pleurochrysis_carterae.AAC.1